MGDKSKDGKERYLTMDEVLKRTNLPYDYFNMLLYDLHSSFEGKFRGFLLSEGPLENVFSITVLWADYQSKQPPSIVHHHIGKSYGSCAGLIQNQYMRAIQETNSGLLVLDSPHKLVVLPEQEFEPSDIGTGSYRDPSARRIYEYEILYREPELMRQLAVVLLNENVRNGISLTKNHIFYRTEENRLYDIRRELDLRLNSELEDSEEIRESQIRQEKLNSAFMNIDPWKYTNHIQRWHNCIEEAIKLAESWTVNIDPNANPMTKELAMIAIQDTVSRDRVPAQYRDKIFSSTELAGIQSR